MNVGDVIREAAGVDMRRPITNIMWGDTVALIKLAPRPIKLIVAPEESALPHSVREEMAKEEATGGPPLGVSLTPTHANGGLAEQDSTLDALHCSFLCVFCSDQKYAT